MSHTQVVAAGQVQVLPVQAVEQAAVVQQT
jgi:hypothetical protein